MSDAENLMSGPPAGWVQDSEGRWSPPADTPQPQTGASSGAAPAPCECMTSWAYISPIHPGHCCFLSPQATCHPDEFAVWQRGRDLRNGVSVRPRAEEQR